MLKENLDEEPKLAQSDSHGLQLMAERKCARYGAIVQNTQRPKG
jgi:hypothetical protein